MLLYNCFVYIAQDDPGQAAATGFAGPAPLPSAVFLLNSHKCTSKALQNTAILTFFAEHYPRKYNLGHTFFPPNTIAMSIFQRDLCTALAVLLQKQSVSKVISKFII